MILMSKKLLEILSGSYFLTRAVGAIFRFLLDLDLVVVVEDPEVSALSAVVVIEDPEVSALSAVVVVEDPEVSALSAVVVVEDPATRALLYPDWDLVVVVEDPTSRVLLYPESERPYPDCITLFSL